MWEVLKPVAGRQDGYGYPARQLPVAVEIRVVQRGLKPRKAHCFKFLSDAQGTVAVVVVLGVEHEGDVVAGVLLPDGAGEFEIQLGNAPSVELDSLEALGDELLGILQIGFNILKKRSAGIGGDFVARSAQQPVERQSCYLAGQVPQGNVDSGQRLGRQRKDARPDLVPDMLPQERVLAQQDGG